MLGENYKDFEFETWNFQRFKKKKMGFIGKDQKDDMDGVTIPTPGSKGCFISEINNSSMAWAWASHSTSFVCFSTVINFEQSSTHIWL